MDWKEKMNQRLKGTLKDITQKTGLSEENPEWRSLKANSKPQKHENKWGNLKDGSDEIHRCRRNSRRRNPTLPGRALPAQTSGSPPLPGEPPSPAPLPWARPRRLRSGARVGGAAHVGGAERAAVS